ncbi:MAG: diguanylate cyclase domain-containing protein [Candidatus Zipacnadales bacterium]
MEAQLTGVSISSSASLRKLSADLAAAPDAYKLMSIAWQWFKTHAGVDALGLATLGPPEPTGFLFAEGPLDSAAQDWLWEELVRTAMVIRPEPGTYPRRRADRRVWRYSSIAPVLLDHPHAIGPWTVIAAGAPAAVVQGWQTVPRTIDPKMDQLLSEAAALSALFMRNVQWLEIDPNPEPRGDLTFEELLELEVGRARAARTAVSLVLVEFHYDSKGRVGYEVPSELAKEVESLVRQTARQGDHVRSISEDCLAVIMPKTDARGAMVGADRLQRRLQEYFADRQYPVSIRIGIGGRDPEETQASELFSRASQALAEARINHSEAAFLHI